MGSERGFTLTELIMVIVILGIVASISVRFIQFSTQGAIDTAERQKMAMAATIMAERMSRELREALPTSVDAFSNAQNDNDGGRNCIRFIPIEQGGRYAEGDRTQAAASFGTEGGPMAGETEKLIAIYPYARSNDLYPPENASVISRVPGEWREAEDEDGYKVYFGEEIAFAANSPQRRFFLIDDPITYCADLSNDRGILRRSDFDSSGIAGVGLADANFSVEDTSLTRNALVTIELSLRADRSGETYSLAQEVQIRNVP